MGDAIFRQRSGVLGVGIVSKCGLLTPAQLAGLGKLAETTGCQCCKMTTRQTLIFLIPSDRLEELRRGSALLYLMQVGRLNPDIGKELLQLYEQNKSGKISVV